MGDNLPAKLRPMHELLTLPDDKLSKDERVIVREYHRVLEQDKKDEDAGDLELGRIGVVASNGQAAFLLPDSTSVKYIEGPILLGKKSMQYYGPKTDDFPDGQLYCLAYGNEFGNPTPAGAGAVPFLRTPPFECGTCPANEFGSGQGKSKACANKFRLIVQLDTFEHPLHLNISPSSWRSYNAYWNVARNNNISLCTLYTKITPHYQKEGGREWATFTFERGDFLPSDLVVDAMKLHLEFNREWESSKEAAERANVDPPEPQDPPQHGDGDEPPF